jgi:hypothetical protein
MRITHRGDEAQVIQRLDEMDVAVAAQVAAHRFLNVGVRVDGKDDLDVGAPADRRQRPADLVESVAEVLPPVRGDQDQ